MEWTYEFPQKSGFYGVTYDNETYYIVHVTKVSDNKITVGVMGNHKQVIEYKGTIPTNTKWYGPIILPKPS